MGGDAVYARAAILQEDATGRPTLDGDLLAQAFQRFKRGQETLDVILVTDDPMKALLLRLPPSLALAGVVAEADFPAENISPASPGSRPVSLVAGVTGALETIPEGCLLIVDPDRGRVVIEPEAEEFVRLQAERGHRPRFMLGEAHLPAQTLGGRTISVWAQVRDEQEIEAAVQGGADGLVIAPGGDILPETFADDVDSDDTALLARLIAAADRIGGGEMTLAAPPDLLDPLLVVKLAPRVQLRWAISPEALPIPLAELRQEMESLVADETEALRPATVPLLVADLTSRAAFDPLEGWAEIILPANEVASLSLVDSFDLPPIRARFDNGLNDFTETAAVATALIVSPGLSAEAKENVRAQEY